MATVDKDFVVKNGLKVAQTAAMGNTTITGYANISDVIIVGGTTINSTSISGNAATAFANAVAVAASDALTKAASAYTNAIAYSAANNYVNTTFAPKSNPTFTGTVTTANISSTGNILVSSGQIIESVNNMGTSSTIDLNRAGYFYKTISAANTIVIANTPASGQAAMFVLELTNGGAFAITWPAAVKWPGAVPPTFTASGVDLISFASRDGGTTWRATASLNYG